MRRRRLGRRRGRNGSRNDRIRNQRSLNTSHLMWHNSHLFRDLWKSNCIGWWCRGRLVGNRNRDRRFLIRKVGMIAWANSFIKVCSVRLDKFASCRVIELPSFVVRRIAHKDSLLHVWRQSNSLVLLNVDITP